MSKKPNNSEEDTFTKSDNVSLRYIWENVNISTLLLLNLFDNDKTNLTNKNNNLKYPIISICYEYGLKNCYINQDHTLLHLLFDSEECLVDKNLSNSSYVTFIDFLINHNQFYYIKNMGDIVHICMKIPKVFLIDVKLVTESRYSETSDVFKEQMRVKYKNVPSINSILGKFLITKNIAYAIVCKKPFLETSLKKELNVTSLGNEYFAAFNKDKEYFTEDKYLL